MPLARKCSRCCSFYDDYYNGESCTLDSRGTNFNTVILADKDMKESFYHRKHIDLCKECKRSFLEWAGIGE